MTAISSTENDRRPIPLDRVTAVVLFLTLGGYPIFRSLEINFYRLDTRADWWLFWGIMSVGHWTCFGLIVWALRRNGEPWTSIGLDWGWFVRHRISFLAAFAVLLLGAFFVPKLRYGTEVPALTGLFPIWPVTTPERLFMIFGAVTAGVVEETLFRGFAFTRLRRVIANPWWILPITIAFFILLHGWPSSLAGAGNYALPGLVFGVAFILLRFRRLELLVTLHFAINAVALFL